MRPLMALNAVLQRQRGALMPWCAVAMGLGVAAFFSLRSEPGAMVYSASLAMLAAGLAMLLWRREVLGPWAIVLIFFALGAITAGVRSHFVAGPVLEYRYYGPIEGEVVAVDRSASDALRVTLRDVVLVDRPARSTPNRLRVSLFSDQGMAQPEAGMRLILTGHLSPPGGPVEPGGFDFQRHAWFLQLGGVGYTRTPALVLEHRTDGQHMLTHLRLQLSRSIQARIPGQAGAFAAAVTTGDRSGLSPETLATMRGSNIAHLLAISGLHMGLLTGFVFASLRLGLAAVPALALRWPIRKWAAMGALLAGGLYLALSGGNVATERAFVQVAVMLVAVMLDRRAITLRSVAIAAVIVLMRRPESLMSPGFQMSFAATAALVAVFTGLSDRQWLRAHPAPIRWVLGLVISSSVAALATAPFSAATFNMVAAYGLAANLVAVPIMGSVVIPAAVLAGLLAPLGWAGPCLWVMELGLSVILVTAETVSSWPGAVRPIVSPPPWLVPVLSLGGLFAIIWRGRTRWAGLALGAAAACFWPLAERPLVLISASGGLVGVLSDGKRSLSRDRGDGFVARIWLENDGDGAEQALAAERGVWQAHGRGQSGDVAGLRVWHGTGQRGAAEAAAACRSHDAVILNVTAPEGLQPATQLRWPEPGQGACLVITPRVLRETGALALFAGGDVITAREVQGQRLWSAPDVRVAWGYQ